MPDLPQLRPREVVRALEALGWRHARTTGSHQIYAHLEHIRPVVVPAHARDVARGTLRAIIRAAGVTEEQFLDAL